MRRRIGVLAVMFVMLALGLVQKEEAHAGSYTVRGVWVSCFEFAEAGLAGKSEKEFRSNADTLFATIKANGCNTVYFHVRSHDDAIYPSKITGWSSYLLSGKKAPSYDPLAILVSLAHEHGLQFHAWMNPYRKTKTSVMNPAKEATTNRIVNQVKEIIDNYDVDGIHFDDYFYPAKSSKQYKNVKKAVRMKHVNNMVKKVYRTVKEKSTSLQFGISPAGNVDYCEEIGADVKTWMSESGYVDYIIPQIYWSDRYILEGKKVKMFRERLALWRSLNERDIPMYIGLALYKAGNVTKEDPGWQRSADNLASQLSQIKKGNNEGYVLFSYLNLKSAAAAKEMRNLLQKICTIQLNKSTVTLKKNKTCKLTLTAWPSRIKSGITWTSANQKTAVVNAKGVVKAKKKGKVYVYAAYGGVKKRCLVYVK